MSPQFKRPIPASSGNTLVEYGVVAALILVVTVPGLYLVGQQIQQWADGVKAEMSHHRDTAISVSTELKDKAGIITNDMHHPQVAGVGGNQPYYPNKPGNGSPITDSGSSTTQPNNGGATRDRIKLHNGKTYHRPQTHPTPPPQTGGSNAAKVGNKFP